MKNVKFLLKKIASVFYVCCLVLQFTQVTNAADVYPNKPMRLVLSKEVNLALKDPEVKAKFQSFGIELKGGSPEDLKDLLANEIGK